jgi:hypothetical protein
MARVGQVDTASPGLTFAVLPGKPIFVAALCGRASFEGGL